MDESEVVENFDSQRRGERLLALLVSFLVAFGEQLGADDHADGADALATWVMKEVTMLRIEQKGFFGELSVKASNAATKRNRSIRLINLSNSA